MSQVTFGGNTIGDKAIHQAGQNYAKTLILKQLIENKIVRMDALGALVFINCDTMQVEYLPKNIFGKETE